MTCPTCGTPHPDGARFCATCGEGLAATCQACGAGLLADARFCSACGAAVDGADPRPRADPTSASAPALSSADELPSARSLERRRVSVLFVDLVDFTAMAETMDPEDVRRIQSRYFEATRAIVARHGGTIEKFIGDAVMAVWGAPLAHEDDAERAARAALAAVRAVERLGAGGVDGRLRARAAVTSGEASVALGVTGQGMVSGDVVNVAARLQSRAPAGGVLVDGTTRTRAADAGRYESIGAVSLRGRTGRIAAFRLHPAADGHGTAPRTVHAGPLVGRDREMRELVGLLRSVLEDGRGRLVAISGVAGIGKSRLAWELARWADGLGDDIAWHEGRAPAYGEGIAHASVAQMVRRRLRIPDGTAPELARRQLANGLADLVPDEAERRWLEPRLATLLEAPSGGAEADRDELFAAWRRFFERVADRTPAVLVFEDFQWADEATVSFVEHIATWTRQRPILVVTLARPEFADRHPTWGAGATSYTALHLARLSDDAMRQLLDARAPDLEPRFVDRILAHAGGVPLYAVEMARMVANEAHRTGRGGRAGDDGGGADAVPVPDSLHGLIAARIDALPHDERRLLLSAAVLGSRFRLDALVALAGGEAATTRERIDALVRRELLAEDEELTSPGAGDLLFVQDPVREVAYGTLARPERRALHLSAAQHLEPLGDEAAEPLAAHLLAAHELTAAPREARRLARRAVAALRHAARRAAGLHASDRALHLLERSLRLVPDGDERAPILEEAATAARAAGRLDQAERWLREVAALHTAAGKRGALARTRAQLASVLLTAQRNASALEELEAAMRAVRHWDRDAGGVELAAQLARARLVIGDDREAISWADRALPAAERLGLDVTAADLLVTRGTARASLGDDEAGGADLRDAIRRAEALGSLRVELRARNNLAWSLLSDDPAEALTIAREGFRLATTMGIGDAAVPFMDIASTAAIETGEWDWAMEAIDAMPASVADAFAVELAATATIVRALRGERRPTAVLDRSGPLPADADPQVRAAASHARAWVAFLAGDVDEARRLADDAVRDYAGSDPPYHRALAARAALWLDDADGAAARLERLEAGGRHGGAWLATATTVSAGVAALRGDGTADGLYAEARAAWTRLGMPLQLALCLLDQRRLLATREDDELVPILERLGAAGLRRLAKERHPRRASGRGGSGPPGRSRRPSAGTARRTGAARRSRPGTDRRSPPG